ncbi:MAG: hypothetical protein H6732_06200 [Alphaproteobacteria bacterium]|nr:hypothetical protein [Alphaproteobacteria bacterium]
MGGASTLELLTWLVAVLALAVTVGGLVHARHAVARAHGPLGVHPVLLAVPPLLTLVALHGVPHAPWHSFFHGLERAAWLRDHPWWQDAASGNLHGPGWYVLVRALTVPTLGWVSPFQANAVLAMLATGALFGLVHAVSRSGPTALAAAMLHATLPVRLRVATTLSLYVGVELALLVAAWLAAVHVRDRSTRTLVPAVAAAVFATHTHLELLPAVPLTCVGVALATAPEGLGDPARRRRALLALIAAGLACLPLVLGILTASAGHLPGAPATSDVLQQAMRTRALVAVTVLVGLAVVAPAPDPARGRRAVVGGGIALALALLAGAVLMSAGPVDGAVHRDTPWATVHAWFSTEVTPAVLPALALAGLAVAWWTDRASFRASVAGVAALAWFHAGTADVLSTWVRVALPATGFLLWPAAVLLTTVHARGGLVLALVLAIMAPTPQRAWLQWTYPSQHEHDLLLRARRLALEAHLPVVVIGPDDHAPGLDPDRFDLAYHRAYLRQLLGPEVQVLTLAQAAPPPDDAVYVRSLQCVRPLIEIADADADAAVYVAGRVWRPAVDGVDLLTALSPCWRQPELATCVETRDGACVTWTCAPGQGPAADPSTYLDPACAAFEATVDLVPVEEHEVRGAALFGDPWPQGGRIGVYRATPRGGTR